MQGLGSPVSGGENSVFLPRPFYARAEFARHAEGELRIRRGDHPSGANEAFPRAPAERQHEPREELRGAGAVHSEALPLHIRLEIQRACSPKRHRAQTAFKLVNAALHEARAQKKPCLALLFKEYWNEHPHERRAFADVRNGRIECTERVINVIAERRFETANGSFGSLPGKREKQRGAYHLALCGRQMRLPLGTYSVFDANVHFPSAYYPNINITQNRAKRNEVKLRSEKHRLFSCII